VFAPRRSARTLACRLGTLAETFGIKYLRERSKTK